MFERLERLKAERQRNIDKRAELDEKIKELDRKIIEEEKRLAAERAAIRYYTVKKGDSLGAIARKQGKSLAAIKKLNPGINPDKLSIGQKIRVN